MAAILDDLDLGTARAIRAPLAVATSLVTALLVCLICALPTSANAARTSVIGGSPAAISTFPFMARITAHDALYRYTCTGTVVAPNMILTAAHCLLNEQKTALLDPATFQVLTGTGSLAVPGTVSAVERTVIDPGYQPSGPLAGWHDAGLIQLSTPVAAPAVGLATAPIWGAGTGGYAVGWGLTEDGELPGEMQVGETVVQSTSYCQGEIGSGFHPLAQLCSLDYPTYATGTCNGDSGGPLLMVSNGVMVEIGITSLGPEECWTDLPRIDTRVDVESAWVAREIAAHPPVTTAAPVTPPTTSTPTTTTRPTTPTIPTPAPTPAPTSPPKLPKLTTASAKRNAFTVVRTDRRLGRHFRVHTGFQSQCRSTSTTTASCTVRWFSGSDDYWGTVSIFEEWEGTIALWNYHYAIRSVDDWCYWHSGHRGRCPVSNYRD